MTRGVALVATLVLAAACAAGPSPTVSPSGPVAPRDSPSPTAAIATLPSPSQSTRLGAPQEVVQRVLTLTGSISPVHDPAIARDGERYYLFSTGPGIPFRCSDDLVEWRGCGQVFLSTPEWARDAVPGVGDNLWAPDISKYDGRFLLYYSVSTFGSNRSAIGLATNATLNPDRPDYKWRDEGLVIASRPTDNYNAIDPNLFVDGDRAWLAFGSFWSGIKLVEVNRATGKPVRDAHLIAIADNLPHPQDAIEAPFITRHGDSYYLFVSHDLCCRGVDSTYNIRVGRSKAVTGPYVDRDGNPLVGGGGTLVYGGSDRWRGPGHNAILVKDETWYLVYHAYDAKSAGIPTLRIEKLIWDVDGWPASPSALAGM